MNIIVEVSAFCGNIHVLWILFAIHINIHVPWILSAFRGYIYILRGYYPHFVEISMFRRYYSHFVEISTSRGYYPHFVDIIYIDHNMSYLAHNVRPIFHIYSFSETDWYITYFSVCHLDSVSCSSSFCLVHFVSEYKLNTNTIQIYVPSFSTSIKASFSSPLNIPVFMLY